MDISRFDLNLLPVFDALLTERNVTRAARRVGLSQPALSSALGRLRAQLGDELFIRTRRGMVPTRRALALSRSVRATLEELEQVLASEATTRRSELSGHVVLEMDDYAELVMLPVLMARVGREMPAITLDVLPGARGRDSVSATMARRADPDITIRAAQGRMDRGRREERLFSDDWVCLVRKGLAGSQRRLESELFTVLSHVVAAGNDQEQVLQGALVKAGLTRRVALRVPEFASAASVAARTDCVAMIPTRMARWVERNLPLDVLDPPVTVPPAVYFASWPRIAERSEAAMWVKRALVETASGLDSVSVVK